MRYSLREALRTWQWYLLWGMLFLNVTAGVMLISQAAPMAQEITGVPRTTAASMVIFISVCNGLGRLFWAWLSDAITRRWVFATMFLLQALLLFLMPAVRQFAVLAVFMMVIGLCYGGGLNDAPPMRRIISDRKTPARYMV